jgi:hypothetical protein
MRGIFFLSFVLLWGIVFSQGNVGIGTSMPNEKLDVNGNIKTNENLLIPSGNIMASNGFGQQGQVLGVNNSGFLQWQNSNYKNYSSFLCTGGSPINQTWQVPNNVHEVEVWIWGSGGSGAIVNSEQGGGGGSGAFIKAKLYTTPLTNITIQVGCGSGQHSAIIYGDTSLYALGGLSGSESSVGLGGGLSILPTSFNRFIASFGNSGNPTTFTTSQFNSTTWVQHIQLGSGGLSPLPLFDNTPTHGYLAKNTASNTVISSVLSSHRDFPGGGGGVGSVGAQGYVIILYN